jgi:hypothetical protein
MVPLLAYRARFSREFWVLSKAEHSYVGTYLYTTAVIPTTNKQLGMSFRTLLPLDEELLMLEREGTNTSHGFYRCHCHGSRHRSMVLGCPCTVAN